jgi:hypothetical protein
MANILLSPIDVDGTVKCLICESNLATAAINTDINSTGNTNIAGSNASCSNSSTSWYFLDAGPINSWGQLSFGVSCLNTVTLRIHGNLSLVGPDTTYEVYLDGVSQASGDVPSIVDSGSAVVDIVITLPAHTPCGSVITVEGEIAYVFGNIIPVYLEIIGTT